MLSDFHFSHCSEMVFHLGYVCISLMTNGVFYLSICLLSICISAFVKDLFKSFVHLKKLIDFCLICRSSVYILHLSTISDIFVANIFSSL